MPHFSPESQKQLLTCDARLQRVANRAILLVDFSIVEGYRGEAAQNAVFAKGASELPWPQGRHNAMPSRAFDFSPYPQDWSDKTTALTRFTFIAGVLLVCAFEEKVKVRFGWDWNRNLDPRDEHFLDWGHFELDEM